MRNKFFTNVSALFPAYVAMSEEQCRYTQGIRARRLPASLVEGAESGSWIFGRRHGRLWRSVRGGGNLTATARKHWGVMRSASDWSDPGILILVQATVDRFWAVRYQWPLEKDHPHAWVLDTPGACWSTRSLARFWRLIGYFNLLGCGGAKSSPHPTLFRDVCLDWWVQKDETECSLNKLPVPQCMSKI